MLRVSLFEKHVWCNAAVFAGIITCLVMLCCYVLLCNPITRLCTLIANNQTTSWDDQNDSISVTYQLAAQKKIFGPCKLKPVTQVMLSSDSTGHQTSVVSRTGKKNPDTFVEAVSSLHLAKEMWLDGKIKKALKIYKHALALAPSHPDVLNEYGEFVENTQKNILLAEHMYCKALIESPGHQQALTNRQRTLPLVEEIDQNSFNRIDNKMRLLVKVPENHPAMRRMKQESYFRHIYHTTGIEGNTFTLSQTRSFVENRIVIAGKSIIEHNEILGMDEALHYVNRTLLHRIGEITVDDILQIHRRVLGFVDPIGAGLFRKTQVFVGNHIPPPPEEVPTLTKEFVDWLNTEEALSLHPIELAALAHYNLVYIHPFYDGNGRTSRLLMNLVVMQAGYPPIIIMKEEKQEYYHMLETANQGDVRPFIRFISRCTERTLDEYIWATSETPRTSLPSGENIWYSRTIIVDSDINNNDVNNNGETDEPINEAHEYISKP